MSGGDYQAAQWLPSPNFWAGSDGQWYVVIHATASGGPQTGYQLATSKEFTDGQSKSVHYINDVDGTVYQIVREADSAWGNCCVDGNSPFDPNYNWNKKTISIENVKHSSDNSEPLTPAQYQSLLALVRDICTRQGIPMQQGTPTTKGVIYHHDLMPIQKARCPGTFPYDTFFADLNQGGENVTPLKLDKDGCVVTIQKSFQLEPGESPDLCGPWSVVATAFAAKPGDTPITSAESLDIYTDAMVDKLYKGSVDHINFPGVMPSDMIRFLNYVRDDTKLIHYQVIAPDINRVKAALKAGYPVIISCNEINVYAWKNTGWVPAYPWQLSTGHVFPVAGLDHNENLICADQLNNSFQGAWPVIYSAAHIAVSLNWACIIQLPDWLAPIPSGDPLDASWKGFNAQMMKPTLDYVRQDFEAEWRSLVPDADVNSGFAKDAYANFRTLKFSGPCITKELDRTGWSGTHKRVQYCTGGKYELEDGGKITFYPYRNS